MTAIAAQSVAPAGQVGSPGTHRAPHRGLSASVLESRTRARRHQRKRGPGEARAQDVRRALRQCGVAQTRATLSPRRSPAKQPVPQLSSLARRIRPSRVAGRALGRSISASRTPKQSAAMISAFPTTSIRIDSADVEAELGSRRHRARARRIADFRPHRHQRRRHADPGLPRRPRVHSGRSFATCRRVGGQGFAPAGLLRRAGKQDRSHRLAQSGGGNCRGRASSPSRRIVAAAGSRSQRSGDHRRRPATSRCRAASIASWPTFRAPAPARWPAIPKSSGGSSRRT